MSGAPPTWPRAAGVLAHLTSLPGAPGCGGLGPEAHAFVRFLANAGLMWWQTLPVGPAGKGFSPYSARSSFAGGAHLISPEALAREGLLEVAERSGDASALVDLGIVRRRRDQVWSAADRFLNSADGGERDDFHAFVEASADWLEEWTLYEAIARAERSHDWTTWPTPIRLREAGAMAEARGSLDEEMRLLRVEQYFFHRQWTALRDAAEAAGVRLMGDVPFYPSLESADVWADQHLFELDRQGRPRAVAGVPPDYFSATGQIWESPIYDWSAHERDGFRWWKSRMARAASLFDAVRIDHFLGMHRCWRVPRDAPTAEHGAWVHSPGRELLGAVVSEAPRLRIVAEDLGLITAEAGALRDAFGFPGMRVLQFAFDADAASLHRPDHHPVNAVVYTGTHDNDTTRGWVETLRTEPERRGELERACAWFGVGEEELVAAMIEGAFASRGHTAIIPLQDALGLGSEARMNRPGVAEGNWRWRVSGGSDMEAARKRLAAWAAADGRAVGDAARRE